MSAAALQESLEGALELAFLGALFVGGDDTPQGLRALSSLCRVQDVNYRIEVEAGLALRSVDDHLEVGRAQDRGEVEQGAGNARDRNAVEDGEVLRVEHAGAVDADAGHRAANAGRSPLSRQGGPDAP